jgi:Phosphotransferase enzyme family
MPDSVAPRLLGADVTEGILLMEELPAGRSLADLLLAGGRAAATAGLVGYATALGSVHAWSIGRTSEFERARARYRPPTGSPGWRERIEHGRGQFLQAAAQMGVATEGADAEIDGIIRVLTGGRYRSFVHGDLCPDNVRLVDGRIRIFDFERSSLGPAALDAAYLLAPFPTCWCFAEVPADIAELSMAAYRRALETGGVEVGEDFDTALTAALAAWLIARSAMIGTALNRDHTWGTATMRPRLLSWTARFAAAAATTGTFPRLRQVAEDLNDRLRSLWPDVVIPAYPALAGPGSTLARPPKGWEPGS